MSEDRETTRAGTDRRVGFFTTDTALVVRSWDAVLERMTGLAAGAVKGRPLTEVAPDLASRGLLDLIRDPIASGATQVLAPALHHYLIRCAPVVPTAEFDAMQQRVVVTQLRNDEVVVGLAFSVEDVTERLEAEHRLAKRLRDADPSVRQAAVQELAGVASGDGAPIESALKDEDWQVRRAAVATIARHADSTLVHSLVAALRDGHSDFNLLSSAIRLLTLTGVDATAALIELLRSADSDLRIQAALALGMQRRPEAVEPLTAALDDPDVNVRFHAIEALGKIGAASAVDRLRAILDTRDFFLSFPALDALVRIGEPAAAPRIVPLLDDVVMAGAAADALGQLGDEDAIAPLVAALERPDAPTVAIVDALVTIHHQYELTSGAGGHVEDLVRRATTPRATDRLLADVQRSSGVHLRNVVTVLGWLRGEGTERALAHLLGKASVNHEVVEALVRFGSPMVDLLTEQLASPDLETRRAAVTALGRIGDRRAVGALVGVLAAGERDLFVSVAAALARLGDGRAFEPLLELLGDADVAVRQAAVGALNSIGDPATAPRVARLLDDPDRNVRESAVRIAGYFGYPACAEQLLARGADPDEGVRAAAMEHLPYLDDPRVPLLLFSTVSADTPRVRAAAAHALACVDAPGVSEALHTALQDTDAWVRYFAAQSIGRRRDASRFEDLATLVDRDPARQVRVAAIEAIGAVGGRKAIDVLASLVSSPDADVAASALRSIGTIEGDAAMPVLRDALRSPDPRRRAAASEALAMAGSGDAVTALQWTASADADPHVSRAAIEGLGTIAGRRPALVQPAIAAMMLVASDPARAGDVVQALVHLPPAAIPALGSVLSRGDGRARAVAVDALGRIARPTASAYLVQALEDADAGVRQRAIAALARLGTRGVGRRLAAIARGDESPVVRRAAELALVRTGEAEGRT